MQKKTRDLSALFPNLRDRDAAPHVTAASCPPHHGRSFRRSEGAVRRAGTKLRVRALRRRGGCITALQQKSQRSARGTLGVGLGRSRRNGVEPRRLQPRRKGRSRTRWRAGPERRSGAARSGRGGRSAGAGRTAGPARPAKPQSAGDPFGLPDRGRLPGVLPGQRDPGDGLLRTDTKSRDFPRRTPRLVRRLARHGQCAACRGLRRRVPAIGAAGDRKLFNGPDVRGP